VHRTSSIERAESGSSLGIGLGLRNQLSGLTPPPSEGRRFKGVGASNEPSPASAMVPGVPAGAGDARCGS
jgi:hypothetical protein